MSFIKNRPIPLLEAGPERELMACFLERVKRIKGLTTALVQKAGVNAKWLKPDEPRTPAQKHTLIALLRALKADYPDAQILGHRDLPWVKKDCPCFDARAEYLNLKPLKLEQ